MKCPNCGQEFDGNRCPNCGRPVAPSPARVGSVALWVSLMMPLAAFGACTALGAGAAFSLFVPLAVVWPLVGAAFLLWLVFAAVRAFRGAQGGGR